MTEINQIDGRKPRLVGINHIALEVGDIDQALEFYGKIFDFTLRGNRPGNAFVELGDQFINLMETPTPHEDRSRHFGLVVDDRSSVMGFELEKTEKARRELADKGMEP
jgi:catechol 2,3-dioxygenase-like lactoylglutathione lyase family enzyme